MLHLIQQFLGNILRDRTQSLEQYILSHNPQTPMHVEQLERQYYARELRNKMI